MPRGGYRPGAGRKKGSKNKVSSESLAFIAKAREFAEFYRGIMEKARAGKQPTADDKRKMSALAAELAGRLDAGKEKDEKPENLTPLELILRTMNDPKVDLELRVKMAQAAAPFVHPRKGEGAGKKDEKADRAKAAGAGKYAPSKPPLALVK